MRPSLLAYIGILSLVQAAVAQDSTFTQIKAPDPTGPHTDNAHLVRSYNVNSFIGGPPPRSLLHWKRDLEFRLNSYLNQRRIIDDIISTSIYQTTSGPIKLTSNGNARFSDLIITNGSLILNGHIIEPTVRIMINKTESYVRSKMNDLEEIKGQLSIIKQKLDEPLGYIYKGLPGTPKPQINTTKILGVRLFKQFTYAHQINSQQVQLDSINFTKVDQVLRDTYMENQQLLARDSKSRLFFEGRKTFWRAKFARQLKSGCCDRLKPLHTSRMMTRSSNQDILAPVLFQSNGPYNREPMIIRQLNTNKIYNRPLIFMNNQLDALLPPNLPYENEIQLDNLVNIRQSSSIIGKKLIFKDVLRVEEAQLSNSLANNKLIIDFESDPQLFFDLSHDNYLLKFHHLPRMHNNTYDLTQRVAGTLVVNAETQIVAGLEANIVNQVPDFHRFVSENLVRVDRPAIIRGPVQLNALPSMFNSIGPQSQAPHNVLIMHVNGNLRADLINGMRIPQDVILNPPQQNQPIRVRGHMNFDSEVRFQDLLNVNGPVCGILMPSGVIPLHMNDIAGTVGASNLLFPDGINAQHITVQSGQFDEIVLGDVYGDAQSLIMRSVFEPLPDGSHLIRAPLRILNLKLFGIGPNQGLLNGFRPQDVLELTGNPPDAIYGKKTFLAPVHATECHFSDVNGLANWTNHLIRIDRPNIIQTINTRLVFENSSNVDVDKFDVEFQPNDKPANYLSNLNFSPEFYTLSQALARGLSNHTDSRYRVLDQVRIFDQFEGPGKVNGIPLDDIVTLDEPFRFSDRYVMVGKVQVKGTLRAGRIRSNYPIDVMDLEQFNNYRIPIVGSRAPVRLNSLVLATNNQASFVRTQMLNGISFSEFANSIMSLTRPQDIDSNLLFASQVNFEGLVRTSSSLNEVKNFKKFADSLRTAAYSFEDGLQCNTVVIKV